MERFDGKLLIRNDETSTGGVISEFRRPLLFPDFQ